MQKINNNRRDFLKITSLSGVGLALGLSSFTKDASIVKLEPSFLSLEINPFIIIDNEGKITLVNPRPDMGQGSTQAVPSLIAEELEVSLDKVFLIQSDGKSKYGSQTAGGSSSVRGLWEPLRKAGAAAKEMLIRAATQRWNVPTSECFAEDGKVFHKQTGRSLTYSELVEEASKFEIPKNPTLKAAKDFKIIGKYNKRLDVPERVTGKAVYGIDVEVPNMLYACILHNPGLHGKMILMDSSETLVVPGVRRVMKCERPMPHRKSEAVAVIANNMWAALKGRKSLKVEWDNTEYEKEVSTEHYFAKLYEAANEAGINSEEKGDFNARYAVLPKKITANYETPFLAHAPIEPESATVHVKEDGTVEVWAAVQGPDGAMRDVAKYLNISPDKIKMNVTLLGGSFGRKAYHDFLLEASFLSKELKVPIKLIWTREDDITQGPYRPGMLSNFKGGLDESGKIVCFKHHAVGESIKGQVFKQLTPYEADDWVMGELSSENNNYNFPVSKLTWTNVKTDIPVVWWRSVYASNFAWGQECFIDEMAKAANKDPLKTRLDLLSNAPRFQNVLNTLADKARWGETLPVGTGKGLAIFKSFDSISASCITVTKVDKGIRIDKVVTVIDCGTYVNPDNVKAQTEGNIVMGLTAAIKGGITFTNGVCDQTNFHQYEIMRLNEMPKIDIHIINNDEKPGGVGEPGLPPIAPALGNAIFAATGKRIRKLPIDITDLG